jgi:hypothetical protein
MIDPCVLTDPTVMMKTDLKLTVCEWLMNDDNRPMCDDDWPRRDDDWPVGDSQVDGGGILQPPTICGMKTSHAYKAHTVRRTS